MGHICTNKWMVRSHLGSNTMARVDVRSFQWLPEGMAVNVEIHCVSQLPPDSSCSRTLLPTQGASEGGPGSWRCVAEKHQLHDLGEFLLISVLKKEAVCCDKQASPSLRIEAVLESCPPLRRAPIFVETTPPTVMCRRPEVLQRFGYLLEDTLRLRLLFIPPSATANPKGELRNQLGHMLDSPELADMVIVAERKEFHVHRAILVARSPVLNTMVCTSM